MSEAKVQLVLAALRNGKTPNGICVGRLDGRCTSSFAHLRVRNATIFRRPVMNSARFRQLVSDV